MLTLDQDGRIRRPGRTSILRTFDAEAGSLPVGFTVGRSEAADTGVTSAFSGTAVGMPALTITGQVAPGSATADRRRAGLFGETIDVSKTVGVRLRAVITGGLSDSAIIPRIGFAVASGSAYGATILSQTTGDVAQLFTNNGTSTNRKIPWKWLASPIRHDITMWWTPADGMVAFAVEGDAVEYYNVLGASLAAGPCFPYVSMQAQATGKQAVLAVHRMEVEAFYA